MDSYLDMYFICSTVRSHIQSQIKAVIMISIHTKPCLICQICVPDRCTKLECLLFLYPAVWESPHNDKTDYLSNKIQINETVISNVRIFCLLTVHLWDRLSTSLCNKYTTPIAFALDGNDYICVQTKSQSVRESNVWQN